MRTPPRLKKIEDIGIYQDDRFFSSCPSIVRRPDGELIVALRRAPERRLLGENATSHRDPNGHLVLVRSNDDGKTWSRRPEFFYAHPFGDSKDPCMVQLTDGSILCTSYGWAFIDAGIAQKRKDAWRKKERYECLNTIFLGGWILYSSDGAHNWEDPIIPPPIEGEMAYGLFGNPVPASCRGAMCEGKNGNLYWAVLSADLNTPSLKNSVHLMISTDRGYTWKYSCPIAHNEVIDFNETSLFETPKGDLVAFIRTGLFDDHPVIVRSIDGGKSFQPWQDAGFKGHPLHALHLSDDSVLLTYGYRHEPYGIRARILDPECRNYATAEEFILRDDGGSRDLGYPWAVLISKYLALIVYYFNMKNGTRHIAGTFVSIQ